MFVPAHGLVEVTRERAEAVPLADAWKDPAIPMQQWVLTERELRQWAEGQPIAPFDVLRDAMTGISGTVLEVGCGVGHNRAVLEKIGGFTYTGVDYSPAAIALARQKRAGSFLVMDADDLRFADQSFSAVISGSVLLHMVDWRGALRESARVAERYLLLHRTPVVDEPTRYFFKKAYGVDCVEIHFNRSELIAETESHGFELRRSLPVTVGQETLVFERRLFHHPV